MIGVPVASIGPSIASIYGKQLRLKNAAVISVSQSGESPDIMTATENCVAGGAVAVARSQLSALAATPLVEAIRRNTHPSRSGDVYVVQEPYWFLFDEGPVAVMHGSPWRYDTYVPVVFAGPGIAAQTIHRLVHPSDVAPTLSSFLGVKPPSSAEGLPLTEVLSSLRAN